MITGHRIRRLLAAPFSRRPHLLQWLRWPNPFRPPYRQKEINLYRPGELGDVVMCLAVVSAIRKRNPAARISFVTKYPTLLEGHPLLDRVLSPEEAERLGLRRLISLRYEVYIPLQLHLIEYLAACVGLRNIPHQIPLPDFSSEAGALLPLIPSDRPCVMVCRQAGPFTPNKDWPGERWDALVARLLRTATVVELDKKAAAGRDPNPSPYHFDLRGRTSQRQYCALLGQADLVLTPLSSAVHVAAAYGVPTLSVLGGYELPANSAYPKHVSLARDVACSPCWLRTACPHDLKCLRAITVDEVFAAAVRLLPALGPD